MNTSISKAEFCAYRDYISYARTATIEAGSEWDGRAIWQTMKNLQSENAIEQSWNSQIFQDQRSEFASRVIETLDESSELNHFMLQCVRIPRISAASPRKIMQIALNIGQLQSEIKLIDKLSLEFVGLYNEFCALNMHEFNAYL